MSVIVDEVVARVADDAPAREGSAESSGQTQQPIDPARLREALRAMHRRTSRRRAH